MNNKLFAQWGQIGVSILSLLIFAAGFPVAIKLGDSQMLLMLIGAAITNAGTVVQYWLGSSSGGAKKDDTIASMIPPKENGK